MWAKAARTSDASSTACAASFINRLFEQGLANIKTPRPIDIEIAALCQQLAFAQIVSTRFGLSVYHPDTNHHNNGANHKRQRDGFTK